MWRNAQCLVISNLDLFPWENRIMKFTIFDALVIGYLFGVFMKVDMPLFIHIAVVPISLFSMYNNLKEMNNIGKLK